MFALSAHLLSICSYCCAHQRPQVFQQYSPADNRYAEYAIKYSAAIPAGTTLDASTVVQPWSEGANRQKFGLMGGGSGAAAARSGPTVSRIVWCPGSVVWQVYRTADLSKPVLQRKYTGPRAFAPAPVGAEVYPHATLSHWCVL